MKTVVPSLLRIIGVFLFWPVAVQAQQMDTLAPLRDFVAVSAGYQQTPLYMELALQNATNFIVSEEDTATIQALFYIKQNSTYIRFGDIEQLANDSIALLVSSKMGQMMLYTNAKPFLTKAKAATGVSFQGTSPEALAKKYSSPPKTETKGVATVRLVNRELLKSTMLPKEELEMQWDTKTKAPLLIKTTRRTLLPLEESDYQQLSNRPDLHEALLMIDSQYFLVREQSVAYVYKKLQHPPDLKIPVLVGDRIQKGAQGGYELRNEYKNYRLTIF